MLSDVNAQAAVPHTLTRLMAKLLKARPLRLTYLMAPRGPYKWAVSLAQAQRARVHCLLCSSHFTPDVISSFPVPRLLGVLLWKRIQLSFIRQEMLSIKNQTLKMLFVFPKTERIPHSGKTQASLW